jgi:hypothetical protein
LFIIITIAAVLACDVQPATTRKPLAEFPVDGGDDEQRSITTTTTTSFGAKIVIRFRTAHLTVDARTLKLPFRGWWWC